MKIHNSKEAAISAIKQYAKIVRNITEILGADFSGVRDGSVMEYYIEASYRGRDKKIHMTQIHLKEL